MKFLAAIGLLALSASAAAQVAYVDLTPDVADSNQYGNINGSNAPNDNIRTAAYSVELLNAHRVTITAQLYDNNFPGNYESPGEIAISIPNFTAETAGFMPAKRLEYRPFTITGILPRGFSQISVENKINPKYRWGIKDMKVTLVEPVGPVVNEPFIPEPPTPVMPVASILNITNFCDLTFRDHRSVSNDPELPLTILEYANQIRTETMGKPSRVDRERFIDYVHYVERVTGKSYLRQSIGTNDYNMESEYALMQIPGEQSEYGEVEHYWCPASCPTGYTQIGIQCDTQIYDTQGGTSINIAEGFESANVCGFRRSYPTNPDFLEDRLVIGTSLSCARDVQSYKYRDVQGTTDWPFKN